MSFEKESKGWKRFPLAKATSLNDQGLQTSLMSPNDKSIDPWNVTQNVLVSLWNSLSPSWLWEKRFCAKDTLSVARAERWATDFALSFHATVIRASPSAFQAQPKVKFFF